MHTMRGFVVLLDVCYKVEAMGEPGSKIAAVGEGFNIYPMHKAVGRLFYSIKKGKNKKLQ